MRTCNIKSFFEKINYTKAIYFMFILGIFLRFSHFGSIPEGFHIDEVGSATDAYTIAYYGTDRYANSYPAYFINYAGGQSALYTYLCAISVYLFGFNAIAIRLPMLIGSIVLGFFGMLIIDKIFKNENPKKRELAKFLFVTLFALAPYPFMTARYGLDCNLMFPTSAVFLYFMLKAIETAKAKHFFMAGIFGGVVLYSYAISYLVMPLFLIILLAYLLFLKNISLKNICLCAIPLFIIALPLLLVQYVNIFDKPAFDIFGITITKLLVYRASDITFETIIPNLAWVINYTLFFDWIDYNTVNKYWTFYPMSVLFFFIGLFNFGNRFILALSERKYLGSAIIFFWFLAELFIGSLNQKTDNLGHNLNSYKINGIFFPVMFFIVLGIISSFSDMAKFKIKRYLSIFTAFLYSVFAISFFEFYFHDYKPQFFFDKPCSDVIEYINKNDNVSRKKVYLDISAPILMFSSTYFLTKPNLPLPYVYFLSIPDIPPTFLHDVRDNYYGFYPFHFDVLPKDLPQDSLYILHKNKLELVEKYKAENFKIIEFKDYVLIGKNLEEKK